MQLTAIHADNEEPENGGGNNDADLPPEREEAPSEYENDGNTATIGYGELKTLGAESRYEEIKMLNGMKDSRENKWKALCGNYVGGVLGVPHGLLSGGVLLIKMFDKL